MSIDAHITAQSHTTVGEVPREHDLVARYRGQLEVVRVGEVVDATGDQGAVIEGVIGCIGNVAVIV